MCIWPVINFYYVAIMRSSAWIDWFCMYYVNSEAGTERVFPMDLSFCESMTTSSTGLLGSQGFVMRDC